MSVIAKMRITDVRQFPDGPLVSASCVYDSTAGADTENARFNKASPNGDAVFNMPEAARSTSTTRST